MAEQQVPANDLPRDTCFITLTYDPEHLPAENTLVLRDWQLFAKRVRKAGLPFRFFHCGEYGSRTARPHYHAAIFGIDWSSRPGAQLFSNRGGFPVYTHPQLTELWGHGLAVVGSLTFESAAYVARYITTKITGPLADDHYGNRKPEYTTMSRRPGIGKKWYDRFKSDVYPADEFISRGIPTQPPRYFDRLLELDDPALLERLKVKRADKPNRPTRKELYTAERVTLRRQTELSRNKTEQQIK